MCVSPTRCVRVAAPRGLWLAHRVESSPCCRSACSGAETYLLQLWHDAMKHDSSWHMKRLRHRVQPGTGVRAVTSLGQACCSLQSTCRDSTRLAAECCEVDEMHYDSSPCRCAREHPGRGEAAVYAEEGALLKDRLHHTRSSFPAFCRLMSCVQCAHHYVRYKVRLNRWCAMKVRCALGCPVSGPFDNTLGLHGELETGMLAPRRLQR